MMYSPEVIRQYRQKEDEKAFDREIKSRVPVELNYDEVTLSCGHRHQWNRRVIDMKSKSRFHCYTCAEEWLQKAAEEEER